MPNGRRDALAPLVLVPYPNLSSKVKPNARWDALAPLVLVSYSILIQNGCQIAHRLPLLIMYWFPIQFSFKFDTNAPWAGLAPLYWVPIQFLFKIDAE